MKIEVLPFGIELIAETEKDKEMLYIFHDKGVRVTAYDTVNHKMIIEKELERPIYWIREDDL